MTRFHGLTGLLGIQGDLGTLGAIIAGLRCRYGFTNLRLGVLPIRRPVDLGVATRMRVGERTGLNPRIRGLYFRFI